MRTSSRRGAMVTIAMILASAGCTKTGSDQPPESKGDKTASADTRATKAADKDPAKNEPDAKKEDVEKNTEEPPKREQKLLPEPRERRLHADRATASSFLWNDWNRFQENYHPLYLLDDDPKTAWVEGADGTGAGEWVRIHVTPVAEASKVRLRIRNGYHKSKSLHAKNARAKRITVSAFPDGEKHSFDLKDSMDWAEVAFDLEPTDLSGIELRIEDVYPGTKYADLCISDVELFVTARTLENPSFEQAKLNKVRAWKKERVDTAKWFQTQEAKSIPVATSYRVGSAEKLSGKGPSFGDRFQGHAQLLARAEKELRLHPALLARARRALRSEFDGWRNVRITPKQTRAIPSVDGIYVPDIFEAAIGEPAREDSFSLPFPGKLAFLKTSLLASFDQAKPEALALALESKLPDCKVRDDGRHYYWQPKDGRQGRKTIDQLLIVRCGQAAERDSYWGYAVVQLLEFDDQGRLAVIVGQKSVTTFEWSSDDNSRIVGGMRLRQHYDDSLVRDQLSLAVR